MSELERVLGWGLGKCPFSEATLRPHYSPNPYPAQRYSYLNSIPHPSSSLPHLSSTASNSSSVSNDITTSFLKSPSAFTIPSPKDVGLQLEDVAAILPQVAPLPAVDVTSKSIAALDSDANLVPLRQLSSPSMGVLSPHELLGAVFSMAGEHRGLVFMCFSLFASCAEKLVESSQQPTNPPLGEGTADVQVSRPYAPHCQYPPPRPHPRSRPCSWPCPCSLSSTPLC